MCDATELSKHFKKLADVINVDPPYYDQHLYSDFSELFWPFLKQMLEPALPLLFKDRILIDWTPTSWRAPRTHEVIARKSRKEMFRILLGKAVKEMVETLKDDGLLIVWFSHKDLKAWDDVINAIRNAGLHITAAIPLPSEHPTRSVTRGGKVGINRVIILVARKKPIVSKEEILERFKDYLKQAKLFPNEEIPKEEIEVLLNAITKALKV